MSILMALPTLGQRDRWLAQSIESILDQDCAVRLVLVTPSGAPVAEMAQHYGIEHLICSEPGLSAAVNAVWREAWDEQYFSWLGDDDLLAPDSLDAARKTLEQHPSKAFVYGKTRYIDASGETLFLSRPTRYAAGYLRYGKNFVPQPGSLIRRRCVESVGFLDQGLKNAMDQDIFTRLHRIYGSVFVNKELSAYRLHDSNITITKGSFDEAAQVRERYSGTTLKLLRNRRANVFLSHLAYAVQKRIPPTATANIADEGYCRREPVFTGGSPA